MNNEPGKIALLWIKLWPVYREHSALIAATSPIAAASPTVTAVA